MTADADSIMIIISQKELDALRVCAHMATASCWDSGVRNSAEVALEALKREQRLVVNS